MAIGTPEAQSHNLTLLSLDPEASRDPSGENNKDVIQCEWPSRVAIGILEAPSHNLTVLSCDPKASRDPSGENDRTFTEHECPCGTATKGLQCCETPCLAIIRLGNLLEYV